jgi:hypothetical protein
LAGFLPGIFLEVSTFRLVGKDRAAARAGIVNVDLIRQALATFAAAPISMRVVDIFPIQGVTGTKGFIMFT